MKIEIFEIQNFDLEHEIADVYLNSWITTYKDLFDENLVNSVKKEDIINRRRRLLSLKHACTFIAVYEKKVIGFCDLGKFRVHENIEISNQRQIYSKPGEIYMMYILEKFQRQGIGKKLFGQASKFLEQTNLYPFILWTLKNNKMACNFYEKLGGRIYGSIDIPVDKKRYIEIAYIFDDDSKPVINTQLNSC
ncbi:MAG: GNAT family N-acetyltransferase [Sphingobacteriia bacterium]|nr:GNAT family N-acetyltransferase [Sphingobacteriia bacterium]